jgi:hypothetical protein
MDCVGVRAEGGVEVSSAVAWTLRFGRPMTDRSLGVDCAISIGPVCRELDRDASRSCWIGCSRVVSELHYCTAAP